MHPKEYLQIILHEILLAPTHNMPAGLDTCMYVCQRARAGLAPEAPCGAQDV
jgi:hypothetical protein